tara:strand:- start:166 stop:495 length:330 start_codon:yes stop_codon:yes gene_type:complete
MFAPLKNKKKIELIFDKGETVKKGPILLKFFNFNDNETGYAISVPKRHIKSAVARNKIKRQLREIINKQDLIMKGVSFFIIYNSPEKTQFSKLKGLTELLFEKLVDKTS